jgi:hypothetical protein
LKLSLVALLSKRVDDRSALADPQRSRPGISPPSLAAIRGEKCRTGRRRFAAFFLFSMHSAAHAGKVVQSLSHVAAGEAVGLR